ncbi:MAG: ABC transporter ATP-binding protein [Pseudomonadota bacterium]
MSVLDGQTAPAGRLSDADPLLDIRNLHVKFAIKRGVIPRVRGHVHAVDDVNLTLHPGETLGLIGESGSGKSTLGRAIVRLVTPTSGEVRLFGRDVSVLGKAEMKPFRRRVQMVFQDPFSSLNPRMTAGQAVMEPLLVHTRQSAAARQARMAHLFDMVGVRRDRAEHYPSEFSGGQRQRLCIARAIALDPDLIIADEAVSALDVSVQAQVLNLFRRLQADLGLSLLFISHDLAVVASISHTVAVMYLGRLVEVAPRAVLFRRPRHPYTEALINAVPRPDPNRPRSFQPIGEIPSMSDRPSGCHYRARCPLAEDRCQHERPSMREYAPGHWAACHVRAREEGVR